MMHARSDLPSHAASHSIACVKLHACLPCPGCHQWHPTRPACHATHGQPEHIKEFNKSYRALILQLKPAQSTLTKKRMAPPRASAAWNTFANRPSDSPNLQHTNEGEITKDSRQVASPVRKASGSQSSSRTNKGKAPKVWPVPEPPNPGVKQSNSAGCPSLWASPLGHNCLQRDVDEGYCSL